MRNFVMLLVLCSAAAVTLADDVSSIKYPSPDKRFALRMTAPKDDETSERTVDLIEATSGKVLVSLGTAYYNHLSDTVLQWSANSKWAAYATRGDKEGETDVYFWNGSTFDEVSLPQNLPDPVIKYRKGDGGSVKNYGFAIKPVRWMKTGGLELSSSQMMLSRESGVTYTGVLLITIAFDAKHNAFVLKTGKTKTLVDE